MCTICGKTYRKLWLFGSGAFIACLGVILVLLWPHWGDGILDSKLKFENGSLTFNSWMETPIPINMKFHIFNWTNSEKIADANVKPHFDQLGPYVFREKHKRVNITWNQNGTISYNQIRSWEFDMASSNGTLGDRITSINPMTSTVAYMMKDKIGIIKDAVNFILNHEGGSLTVTKTVGEILFDGYKDPLLTFLKSFNTSLIDIPFDRFGWFVDRNNSYTYDGRFTMYTDKDSIKTLGLLTEWNGRNQTSFFEGNCGKVFGSSGELWPREIDQSSKSIFVSDMCRTITLNVNEKYDAYGIEGRQWKGDAQVFDNGHLSDDNRCFCYEKDFNKCPATGVLDISKCKFGAPVAMSYPHFYLADPSYVNAVDGMNPNKSDHEFTIALEPTTGIPLNLAARIQLNMFLRRDSHFDIFKSVPNVLMPILWFSQEVSLDENLASEVKLALLLPKLGVYIGAALVGIAVIIILAGVVLSLTDLWSRHLEEDEEVLTNDVNEDD